MKQGPAWLTRYDDGAASASTASAASASLASMASMASMASGPTVAVKDAIDLAGLVTSVGARARKDAPPADADAVCVAAVRRSGGRVIGKTNLTELCWFADGVNEFTGTPVNPLDPSRVPGGSSSGSAVVVALGEADVALGTDAGGSVRIPAACCGVAGLKTTRGRVSKIGVFPLAPELDTVGPLARDVAGLVMAMRLLEPSFTVPPATSNEMRPRVVRLRLGDDMGVDPAVDDAVDAALLVAGWRVRDLHVPAWDGLARESSRILDAGAGKAHAYLLERPELLSDQARSNIENGLGQSPERVSKARMLLAGLGRLLATALADADAIVLPTLAGPPPLLEERKGRDLTWLTVPFNVLGWPAVALPTVRPVVGGPVPAAVQLVGLPRSEEQLLSLAARLPSQR
jgi:amidase